jgi:hypothetical protein
MIQSKLLRIHSSKRINQSDSSSSFSISFNNSDLQEVKKISVVSISIPNVMYNVNGTNNRLWFRTEIVGGVVVEDFIDIPDGFYTADQLVPLIETALNDKITLYTAGGALSLSQSSTTSKITVDFVGGANHRFTFLDVSSSDPFELTTIHKVIGLDGSSPILSNGDSFTFPNMVDLDGVEYFFIHSRDISGGLLTDGGGKNYSAFVKVPVYVGYGVINHFLPPDEKLYSIAYKQPRNLQSLNIRLRDEFGNCFRFTWT